MKILAVDTSTSINTVALCENDALLVETSVDAGRSHSERLLNTVRWVLAEGGLALNDLDALAVSIGPGSFTGLRVGAATWKGLALANRLPLIAVPTLDAMTRLNSFHDATVCPMIDAKMGEVFGAMYAFEAGQRAKLTPDRVCAVEALLADLSGPIYVLGDGATRYRDRILACMPEAVFCSPLCSWPRAAAVGVEAYAMMQAGVETDPARAVPVYLRKSQPEEARAARKASPPTPGESTS